MSSADFLFTPSVQRVLAATLPNPERSFTLQELLALAAAGRGSAQKQIERLLDAGVLREEPRRGRQRAITANTEYFLYPELSSIARKTFALSEPLQRTLSALGGVDDAFVYGSVAKGADTGNSDIDLLVIGTTPLIPLSEAMHELEQTLGRTIHFNLYTADEWRELVETDPVVRQIADGPKLQLNFR